MRTYRKFIIVISLLLALTFVSEAIAGGGNGTSNPPQCVLRLGTTNDDDIGFAGCSQTVWAYTIYNPPPTWSGPGTFTPTTGLEVTWTAPTTAGDVIIYATDPVCTRSLTIHVQKQILVDKDAEGYNDGYTWPNAFTSLQNALDDATSYNEIWVADGTYKPSTKRGDAERSKTFELINGVEIYGGFAGTESSKSQRNWTNNVTTLSGDIDDDGLLDNDNAWHVIYSEYDDTDTVLDGFTVTKGYANGSSPDHRGGGIFLNDDGCATIENCKITGNYATEGGGMYVYSVNSHNLKNCELINNSATSGGGLYSKNSNNQTVTSCVFNNNKSTSYGGGMYTDGSTGQQIKNSVFLLNRSANGGGLSLNYASGTETVKNCIFWGNSSSSGNGWEIYAQNYSEDRTSICYSDIAGGILGSKLYPVGEFDGCGGSNKATEPKFVDMGPDMLDETNGAGSTNYVEVAVGANYSVGDVIEYDRDGTARTVISIDDTKLYIGPHLGANSASGKLLCQWDNTLTYDFSDTTNASGGTNYIYTFEADQYEVGDIIVYDNDGVSRKVTSIPAYSNDVYFAPYLSSSSQSGKNVENWGKTSAGSLNFTTDLELTCSSTIIDAGDGSAAPSTDILGRSRVDSTCRSNTGTGTPNYTDIGAYERQN
jgi:predicted outer membrane repeat protein